MLLEIKDKHVGEQDANELEQCLLNPDTRNVVKIAVNDYNKAELLLETFMGESVPLRRKYILEHSEEANG